MSFDHILNKLAEKHILAGNKDFAYRLVEASEKECSHCGDKSAEMMKRKSKHFCPKCSKQTKCALKGCEAKMMYAEMHKQGGKVYCSKDCAKADKMKKTALDDMIEKYAGKSEKGSYKDAIKELPGFSGMFGNGFCFNTKEQASNALAIAEQAVNFLNWKVERHDDGFMVISRGKDKEASVLKSMLNKYAGIEDLKKWQAEHRKGKKSSVCPDCGKKKCTCSSMTACAGSMCKAKMQKRHMHMAGGNHYCCAECAAEHMGKKAYASDHHDTRMEQYPEYRYQAPEWLQHEFGEWLNNYHGSLHPDDDSDLLWDKFMLEKFGPIDKYAKTKKKAFVNAGDLLRKYAQEFQDLDPSLSGNPEMAGYRREQEQMGYQPTKQEEEEYNRARNTSGNTENPWDFGSDEAGIWDQGYDAGYDAGRRDALQSSDDSYPMSYNPEDRGLY